MTAICTDFREPSILDVRMPFSLFVDCERSKMKKIDLIDFYQMGNWLGYLRLIGPGKPTTDTYNYLSTAAKWLVQVCSTDNIVELRTCRPAAKSLLESIHKLLNGLVITNVGSEITPHDASVIHSGLTRFEHALLEECRELATYFVSPKRNYSTEGLIQYADNEFPDSIKDKLSAQTIIDIKAAGRCIAFEMGTASAMHSYRALEAIALDYFNKRSLTLKPKSMPGLFSYLDALLADGADKQAVEVGQQLRLRRNPLMHPTDNYDVDEAIEAFQLCTAAITALVRDMEKRGLFPKPTPPPTSTS